MTDWPCPLIMPYCVNRNRDCCQGCAIEGKLRRLEPETLNDWERFELPSFSEMLEMSSHAKLAVLWLALYYMQRAMTRDV